MASFQQKLRSTNACLFYFLHFHFSFLSFPSTCPSLSLVLFFFFSFFCPWLTKRVVAQHGPKPRAHSLIKQHAHVHGIRYLPARTPTKNNTQKRRSRKGKKQSGKTSREESGMKKMKREKKQKEKKRDKRRRNKKGGGRKKNRKRGLGLGLTSTVLVTYGSCCEVRGQGDTFDHFVVPAEEGKRSAVAHSPRNLLGLLHHREHKVLGGKANSSPHDQQRPGQ
jgi:hypothetical protein